MNILIFRECEWWVAQCLEYDIATQARTLNDVQYEIQRAIIGRIFAAQKLEIEPFEGIPAAPTEYRKIFEDANKTLKIALKPIQNIPVKIPSAFMLPKEASVFEY